MNTEIIIAIIGAVGGVTGIVELIKYFATRKARQRQAESNADLVAVSVNTEEWHMWREQLDRMNDQIEKKDERIEKLNNQLSEKESRFQEQVDRYIEQTKRLRDCQDREYQSNIEIQRLSSQVTALTQEVGDLKLEKEETQCVKKPCPFRKPQNNHTRKVIAEMGVVVDIDEIPSVDPKE